MPSTYQLYNSTDSSITIDDVPAPVTVPARGSASMTGNSVSDVLQSILLRKAVFSNQLSLSVNNKRVDYAAILKTQGVNP